MERAFRDQAVLSQQMTVIGGEDNKRLLCDTELIQAVQDAPDLRVHERDHAVVDSHVFAQGIVVDFDGCGSRDWPRKFRAIPKSRAAPPGCGHSGPASAPTRPAAVFPAPCPPERTACPRARGRGTAGADRGTRPTERKASGRHGCVRWRRCCVLLSRSCSAVLGASPSGAGEGSALIGGPGLEVVAPVRYRLSLPARAHSAVRRGFHRRGCGRPRYARSRTRGR